jgi:nucleosome-remodeling factor subunit BPTF
MWFLLAKNITDENMDESDKRKSPQSPKKIKAESESEKGEVKDSDAAKGADQSEMAISKMTEKKDRGKESRVWRAAG